MRPKLILTGSAAGTLVLVDVVLLVVVLVGVVVDVVLVVLVLVDVVLLVELVVLELVELVVVLVVVVVPPPVGVAVRVMRWVRLPPAKVRVRVPLVMVTGAVAVWNFWLAGRVMGAMMVVPLAWTAEVKLVL